MGNPSLDRVACGKSHVAHVAHLLGDEGPVGEILLVGRPVGVDSEGHAHLSQRELQSLCGLEARVGVEHLDLALVAEVYLRLVADDGR